MTTRERSASPISPVLKPEKVRTRQQDTDRRSREDTSDKRARADSDDDDLLQVKKSRSTESFVAADKKPERQSDRQNGSRKSENMMPSTTKLRVAALPLRGSPRTKDSSKENKGESKEEEALMSKARLDLDAGSASTELFPGAPFSYKILSNNVSIFSPPCILKSLMNHIPPFLRSPAACSKRK